MQVSKAERCADTSGSYWLKIGLPLTIIGSIVACTCAIYTQETYSDKTTEVIDVSCSSAGAVQVLTRSSGKVVSSYWNPSLFLSITFGFGHFSYAAAKGIDVAWDLVVGRVGQILLAILSYPVIRRSLYRAMEQQHVRIPTYAAFKFDKISLSALSVTTLDLLRSLKPSWRPIAVARAFNWRYLGYVIVLLYILGFSTIVSIMTGYQAVRKIRRNIIHDLETLANLIHLLY